MTRNRVVVLVVALVLLGLVVGAQFAVDHDGIEVVATPPSSAPGEHETTPGSGSSTSTVPTTSATAAPTSPPAAVPVFVYAARVADTTVAVYQQDVGGGRPEELFRYQDVRQGEDDPKYARPVDVAISPDGGQVAYGVGSALYVRDLADGKVRTLVSSTPRPPRTMEGSRQLDLPPRWSIPAMNPDVPPDDVWGIYQIGSPLVWSPDGLYVAFHQGWWEGSDFGIVEVASGKYHRAADGHALSWLPDGRVVVAGDFYVDPGDVCVSRPGKPSTCDDITRHVPEPPVRDYEDVAVARSGLLAVSYQPWEQEGPIGVALISADGSGFRPLALGGSALGMAFTADESALLVVERHGDRSVLVRHPLAGGAPADLWVLPVDLPGWADLEATPVGDVAVVATTALGPWPTGPAMLDPRSGAQLEYRSRFHLIDAATGAVRFESRTFYRSAKVDPRVALRPARPGVAVGTPG